MKPLSLNVLREMFLEFFQSKDHLRLDSYPLVPQDDQSLLLINAGMAPLKKYFTGEQTPPSKRITTCQKCIRTLDIENVGKTSRHGTFFEMLGNFSFGDYFKEEAIAWAWEFLTETLAIPQDLLYPSVYEEDDEAFDIWTKIGIPAAKIARLGKEDNFWEIGAGPCGPCSEIYYDRGEEHGCGSPDCKPGCECDRFVEVWNIVFTQFDSDGAGNYTPLEHPNIDTGMGLERLAAVMQGVGNLFEVDTIKNVIAKVDEISGVKYTGSSSSSDVSIRIITDHIRASAFLIGDGVIPSNEGRGYILRRLLRRAARHGKLLGIQRPFLTELAETVIKENSTAYPELTEKHTFIIKTISVEEERFRQTIDSGLHILDKMITEAMSKSIDILSGKDVFRLYDTYGFPLDLTQEITEEHNIKIDKDGFDTSMELQRKRAREARMSGEGAGWTGDEFSFLDPGKPTEFIGYDHHSGDVEITTIIKDKEQIAEISGGEGILLLNKTPFYAESGGQVADIGEISTPTGVFAVTDVRSTHDGQFFHIGTVKEGRIALGKASAQIDSKRRLDIMRNHSSIHLLQAALRSVLGNHVEQSGSYVDSHRARFDFTHYEGLTAEQLARVEYLVNEKIFTGNEISVHIMGASQAKEEGALALFGEKYGDKVRVIKMGDFSTELCGGTHLTNTAQIGLLKIISEASVAAGVRRIEAITGFNTLAYLKEREEILFSIKALLKANTNSDISDKLLGLQDELKSIRRELETTRVNKIVSDLDSATPVLIGSVELLTGRFDNIPMDALRSAAVNVTDKRPNAVVLLAAVNQGKLHLVAECGKQAVAFGAYAGKLLKAISPIVGGGGGGRPESATSGGKDPSKLADALKAAVDVLKDQINNKNN